MARASTGRPFTDGRASGFLKSQSAEHQLPRCTYFMMRRVMACSSMRSTTETSWSISSATCRRSIPYRMYIRRKSISSPVKRFRYLGHEPLHCGSGHESMRWWKQLPLGCWWRRRRPETSKHWKPLPKNVILLSVDWNSLLSVYSTVSTVYLRNSKHHRGTSGLFVTD